MASRRKTWFSLLLMISMSALLTVTAQPLYRARTELVNVQVSVIDRRAQHVSGLTHDQFQVREEGVPSAARVFRRR